MTALLKLLVLPLPLTDSKTSAALEELEIPDADDPGYQASFSKLGASESIRADPVGFVADPRVWLATGLVTASQSVPGKVSSHFVIERYKNGELT
jgi:exportin-2 (importin alpha re-exporter)